MADAVRASQEDTQRMLARSRRTWSSYTNEANSAIGLPLECIQLRNILGRVPAFPTKQPIKDGKPTQLKLEHRALRSNRSELFISGRSTWRTSAGKCSLKAKILRHQLLLGTQRTTSCSFTEDSRFANWPGVQNNQEIATEGNYIAILAFAWAYILSARWLEVQQSKGAGVGFSQSTDHMRYFAIQAKWTCVGDEQLLGDIDVDLGAVDDDAARWWSAILATGEGWRATITRNDKVYRSPWSFRVAGSQCFKLRRKAGDRMPSNGMPTPPPLDVPPSSEAAVGFLFDFCVLHNIRGQCSAALAAALLFPCLRDTTVTLPRPRPQLRYTPPSPTALVKSTPLCNSLLSSPSQQDFIFEESRLIPYYMTLSCNSWGMRPLLYSAFFDPEVYCNLVSPWLEPAFETIDSIVKRGDYETLAIVMGRRQPTLAALWLGAIITGMEGRIFQAVRTGLSAIDIHAAAWTATIHSFIGLGCSTPCNIGDAEIRRSDECRLLFLTDCEGYSRVPICPWQPFGTVTLQDTEIEVRQHAQCQGHCLQYMNWSWELINGMSSEDRGFMNDDKHETAIRKDAIGDRIDTLQIEMQKIGLPKSESLSELATRSIFGWLRVTGYPPNEKDIRAHSWIDLEDSDEDIIESTSSAGHAIETFERVEAWLNDPKLTQTSSQPITSQQRKLEPSPKIALHEVNQL